MDKVAETVGWERYFHTSNFVKNPLLCTFYFYSVSQSSPKYGLFLQPPAPFTDFKN